MQSPRVPPNDRVIRLFGVSVIISNKYKTLTPYIIIISTTHINMIMTNILKQKIIYTYYRMAGEYQRNDCKRMVEPEHGTHRQGRGREFGRTVQDTRRRGKSMTKNNNIITQIDYI